MVVKIDDLSAVRVGWDLGEEDGDIVLLDGNALHAYVRLRRNEGRDKTHDQHDEDGDEHQDSEHYLLHRTSFFTTGGNAAPGRQPSKGARPLRRGARGTGAAMVFAA